MKNMFIVGVKNKSSKHVAEILAKKINLAFFDAEQYFSEKLILFPDFPLEESDEKMKKYEKDYLKILTETNKVIYISNDMFLSNKNYNILKDSIKILVVDFELEEVEQGLQNLLSKHCNYIVENNENSIDSLIKNLKF